MSMAPITAEVASDVVSALYREMLHREPDAVGLTHYVERITSQGAEGLSEVVRTLAASTEAVEAVLNRSDVERVTAVAAKTIVSTLYRELLGREADPVGFGYHASRIVTEPGPGLSEIVRNLSNSAEAIDRSLSRDDIGRMSKAAAAIIVETLYDGLVAHEPDKASLDLFVNALSGGALASGFEAVLQQLLTSAEVRDRFARTKLIEVGIASAMARTPRAFERRRFVALGSTPHTSYLMRVAGIGRESGPFDHLFSNPRMISHCIEDDFSEFLDRRFFKDIESDGGLDRGRSSCDHLYYKDKLGIDGVFNGLNPNDDAVYADLVASVERFRRAAKDREESFWICTVNDYADAELDFDRLATCVREHAPAAFLSFARIMPPGRSLPTLDDVELVSNGRSFAFHPSSPLGELTFQDGIDDIALFKATTGLVW